MPANFRDKWTKIDVGPLTLAQAEEMAQEMWNAAIEAAAKLCDEVEPGCQYNRRGYGANDALEEYREKIKALMIPGRTTTEGGPKL